MLKTFYELKTSNAIQVAGATPNSDRFKALLNEAVERLLTRGDSSGTVVPIQVCVRSGCVVFPRYVSTIREAKTCCGPLWIKNEYQSYSFIDRGYYDSMSGFGYDRCESSLYANGRVPTYDTIIGSGRTVRAYAQTNMDYGKTVTIFGVDNNNQTLMHREPTGEWREGWILVLGNPYAETAGYVSNIHRVLKDRTQKPVTLFAWNTTDSVLENLATYDPGEMNPSFARYRLNMPTLKNDDGTEKLRSVSALVKLNFIPVEYDTDLVPINNTVALKFMIQGILLEEGGNDAAAQSKIDKAISELNMQVRNDNWNNQITVNADSVGGMICSPI